VSETPEHLSVIFSVDLSQSAMNTTVTLEVPGLSSGRQYFYTLESEEKEVTTGSFKTAPNEIPLQVQFH
jgi:phosphodiesterase/alkaline phosphatase D-like protein